MKHIKILVYVAVAVIAGYFWHQQNVRQKLNAFYLEQLQVVKSRMVHGSSVNSQEELGNYQDQIELCMHLDGYNGLQVMELRAKAFKNALLEEGNGR